MLSILIPTFNDDCVALAHALATQCCDIPGLEWELIVGDDGSTNQQMIDANSQVDAWPHCRYWLAGDNRGRSVIRNALVREARGQWLLLIDADLKVMEKDYIRHYVSFLADHPQPCACCGGYRVGEGLASNLRYLYEKSSEPYQFAKFRKKAPYCNFKLSNTLVFRDILLRHPLDERILHYGYEDVMLGKDLENEGVTVEHIDNPVLFERFESNANYVKKIEDAVNVLVSFREELRDYSSLLSLTGSTLGSALSRLAFPVLSLLHNLFRANLLSSHPSLLAFRFYQLYLLLRQLRKSSRA